MESDPALPPTTYWQRGVVLAHAALPVTPALPRQVQPRVGRTGVITFDGRIDNRPDLLRRLADLLAPDACDAALALAAYETWGTEGLAHLIGDWSLTIWDSRHDTILLASDFAGVRPLYYSVDGTRVMWSTRLQPLVDWAEAHELDDVYVAGWLTFTGSPDRTPYRRVYSVPPGCAVHVTANETRVKRFWSLPVAETIRYSRESEYEDHLRDLFSEAVRCRMPAGSRCLSELSGGLDSSSVVSMAAKLIRTGEIAPASFATLTIEHEGSLDTPFYTLVERYFGFEKVHLSAADYPWVTEEETGGVLPAFWELLMKRTAALAREMRTTTYLTGKLGDDVMGGWWDDSEQVAGLLCERRIGAGLKQALAWSKALQVPIPLILWRAFLSSLPPQLVTAPRNPIAGVPEQARDTEDSIDPALRKQMGLLAPEMCFSREWMHARPERRRHCRTLTEVLEMRKLQAPEPLDHLDFVHPYAHRPLVEFMLAVPADIVCRPGEPRRLMRRAFRQFWPPKLHRRLSKDDFSGVFINALRPLANEMLHGHQPLQVVERGYVNRKSLVSRLERLSLALSCNEPQLRQIILLEFWLRNNQSRLFSNPTCQPEYSHTSG